MNRVHDHFHVEVPLRSFFNAPTVASLAVAVERLAAKPLEGGA